MTLDFMKILENMDIHGPSPDVRVGSTIRTKKTQMTGKVERIAGGKVFFREADGPLLKVSLGNVAVVQELADQDDEEITEISTPVLADYKSKAGAEAGAADRFAAKVKNPKTADRLIAHGTKRVKGVIQATNKQFANDAKKHVKEGPNDAGDDNFTPADIKRLEGIRDLPTLKAQAKVLVKGKAARRMKPEKIAYFYDKINSLSSPLAVIKLMYDLLLAGEGNAVIGTKRGMSPNSYRGRFGEGTMGGINRSAPAQDVSYEKMLDEIMKEKDEMKLNELSVDKMQKYMADVQNPENGYKGGKKGVGRTLAQVSKAVSTGIPTAKSKIAAKTGDRSGNRPKQGPIREKTLEERLAEFVDEAVDKNKFKSEFSDILGKQHAEVQKAKPSSMQSIPLSDKRFTLYYRQPTDNLVPLKWIVRNEKNEIVYNATSADPKQAFNDAEDWLVKSQQVGAASTKVTLNFNAAFGRQIADEGQTIWVRFTEGPSIEYSYQPIPDFHKIVIKNADSERSQGGAFFPVTTLSAKNANSIGLKANSRYTMGPRIELDPKNGVFGFEMTWHSRVEKGVVVPIKEPAITTSASTEDVDEAFMNPWHGYVPGEKGKADPKLSPGGDPNKISPNAVAPDKKLGALAKAPKTSMQGKDDIRFSELVQDTIEMHGIKWAFQFYVVKHGLPPRQFRIFAGI